MEMDSEIWPNCIEKASTTREICDACVLWLPMMISWFIVMPKSSEHLLVFENIGVSQETLDRKTWYETFRDVPLASRWWSTIKPSCAHLQREKLDQFDEDHCYLFKRVKQNKTKENKRIVQDWVTGRNILLLFNKLRKEKQIQQLCSRLTILYWTPLIINTDPSRLVASSLSESLVLWSTVSMVRTGFDLVDGSSLFESTLDVVRWSAVDFFVDDIISLRSRPVCLRNRSCNCSYSSWILFMSSINWAFSSSSKFIDRRVSTRSWRDFSRDFLTLLLFRSRICL